MKAHPRIFHSKEGTLDLTSHNRKEIERSSLLAENSRQRPAQHHGASLSETCSLVKDESHRQGNDGSLRMTQRHRRFQAPAAVSSDRAMVPS
jgi:hypothetical protein